MSAAGRTIFEEFGGPIETSNTNLPPELVRAMEIASHQVRVKTERTKFVGLGNVQMPLNVQKLIAAVDTTAYEEPSPYYKDFHFPKRNGEENKKLASIPMKGPEDHTIFAGGLARF